jgi:hypothetical protein
MDDEKLHEYFDLLDMFAAAVLAGGLEQGVESNAANYGIGPDLVEWWHSPKKIAERAYSISEAMIRERARRLKLTAGKKP